MSQGIQISREGQVERVVLSRPAALNALTPQMTKDLLEYFGKLPSRHDTRVVILSGEGGHFCAGLDIKADLPVLREGPAYAMRFMADFGEIILRMRHCPQPIVVSLKGAAAGAGLALALASDIRIGTPSLRMNAAFAKLGLSGTEMGISYLLPRIIGAGLASELMLTGRFIGAKEAERIGLISRIVEIEELNDSINKTVRQLLETGPLGLRLTKETINIALAAVSLETAIAIENRNQSLCFQSRMPVEGISAFREKRPPSFQDV